MAEHPDAVGSQPPDVINTIARTTSADDTHCIYYRDHGAVRSLTLAELDRRAARVARYLHAMGLRPRDRVGITAANRIEWVLLDLAVLKNGAVTAGIDPGSRAPDDLAAQFGLKFFFVEGAAPAGAVRDIDVIRSWAEADSLEAGFTVPPPYDPADICAIKQTSGSTGAPKGLEATVASVNCSLSAVQDMFGHGDGDNILVFLELRFLQQRYWIYSALAHHHDVTLADAATSVETAKAASPTVVMGVPGFYEHLRARLEAEGALTDPEARRAAIQAELGGRVRYLWTGSAPAGLMTLKFFNDAGVPLYQGYGLNETCIVSKNYPGASRIGSVGRPLPHKRIRFDKDGILVVGSSYPVNTRYTWAAPGVSEKTFLATGEVRTFDIGHVDDDGFLYIDGRVDDIITPSSGYNVLAPAVEEHLREFPEVHDCAVFGSGKPFLTAIISPARPDTDIYSIAQNITVLNRQVRHEQRVYAVIIANEQFSLENGMLNAQYKLRRSQIKDRYADDLDLAYRKHNVYNDESLGDASVLALRSQIQHTEEAERLWAGRGWRT